MVIISIASLIYKSKKYADWIYDSVHEFTPHLRRHEAEFFFVANDATPAVLRHLAAEGYPHYVNDNPKRTEAELFAMGYGWPEYIHRVYRGWNSAIVSAAGEIVVLVNSDNFFSPDWLENLLKYLSPTTIVCSKLVERNHPKYGVFPGAYHAEFGSRPDDFDRDAFVQFVEAHKKTGLEKGGAFMPCAFHKRRAVEAGLYPEGNIAGKTFRDVAAHGDQVFVQRLARIGVRHVTALDSIVYHLKEGEMDEQDPTISREESMTTRPPQPHAKPISPVVTRPLKPIMVTTHDHIQYLSLGKIHFARTKILAEYIRKKLASTLPATKVLLKKYAPPYLYNSVRSIWRRLQGEKPGSGGSSP